MDPVTPLHQEPLNGDTSEAPPRTCTRSSPCHLQGCLVCCTPTNHVRNLDEELDSSEATQTPLTADQLPHPPPDHLILIITAAFKRALLKKDITILKSYVHQYLHQLKTNVEFMIYDCSDLHAYYLTAEDILTSHSVLSTPLPASPPPSNRVATPSASFKAPKLVVENWSGNAFDFYAWLASILHGFALAQTDDPGKLHATNSSSD